MIALALVYVGLATIVGAVLAAHRVRVVARAVVVVVVPVLAFAVWQAAQPPTGWPATGPPKDARYVASYVVEPDASSKGEIDLWMVPAGATRPRAYTTPYTRRLHEQVMLAQAVAKAGGRVGVTKVGRKGEHGPQTRFKFYLLPPPGPPRK